jgi:thioredoxin 1
MDFVPPTSPGTRWAGSRAAGVAMVICATLILVAGGCSGKVRWLHNEAEVRDLLATADKPVLMDFFKGGCASCMFLDPGLEQLADEYDGRVIVARYELMRFWLEITSFKLWKEHRIGLYPTVVLFVNGKERKRWAMDYFLEDYRRVLDQVAGPAPEKPDKSKAAEPPGKPKAAETPAKS